MGVQIRDWYQGRFLSVSMFLMVIGAGIFGTGLTMALVGNWVPFKELG